MGIIAGASFVKVPQISALLGSKSAEGLAASGFELENIGLTIHAAYGYLKQLPFGTYGETTVMLLQNTVLLALVYKYAKVPASRIVTVAATNLLIVAAVMTGAMRRQCSVTRSVTAAMQRFLISRCMQAEFRRRRQQRHMTSTTLSSRLRECRRS